MNNSVEKPRTDSTSFSESEPFFGRMNDPTGSAVVVGLCGDEMEFYLYIVEDRIVEAKYYTNGCEETRQCGRVTAQRATDKLVMDALTISPREIIESLPDMRESGRHRAIADFLLIP